jgi:demethoxyubiquinone hydroxylase (CLK1/Coq7/Cat5 family)
MIRVDQAGETGAARIYAGQLAVMGGRHAMAGEIRHMAHQEQRHLDGMNTVMARRGVRPTVFGPFWHVAGFALGAGTALLGPKAAMACTEAVETVIDEHYGEQTEALADGSDPELKAKWSTARRRPPILVAEPFRFSNPSSAPAAAPPSRWQSGFNCGSDRAIGSGRSPGR